VTTQVGADTKITFTASNSITLKNVQMSSLSEDNFLFV
jgi:hypothetical protein